MEEALQEARRAYKNQEVPVGAVLVKDAEIISRGRNQREGGNDPTAHAEIQAIREASAYFKHWRLNGTTLYVTLEPCIMCAGALVQARVDRLVFGAYDPKAGAVESLYCLLEDRRLNHRLEVQGGVLREECSQLLQSFFKERR